MRFRFMVFKKQMGVLMFMLMLFCSGYVQAATTATIENCLIDKTDASKVVIEARASSILNHTDGCYYLFALQPYDKTITNEALLLKKCKQKSKMSFTVDLNLNHPKSILYRKFVLAVKSDETYKIISNPRYITNPERLAQVTKAFPKAASKKGLHIQPDMISDAEDLGIKHAAVNICLDLFISGSKSNAVPYVYQGKTYYFSNVGCNEVDRQTIKLSQNNVVISGILLLRDRGAGRLLVPPKGRGKGKPYYGFNTMTKEGTETLEALMHFLGERYMNSNGKYGTIVNWIVGNEVNDYGVYNYMGELSFKNYIDAYTRSFRICDIALRSVYRNARVYISLDHLWNLLQPHGQCFTSKATLDAFAKQMKAEGEMNWNLAFHPYPAPLTDPVFWDDHVTSSDDTPQITMKNLDYLTDYAEKHLPKDLRIILSEQGFTSRSGGTNKQKLQAAAYAYAYYLTEFHDKVDSFIMNRHVDHVQETSQGLYLGVWKNTSGMTEYAKEKKVIWDVFKYIDSAGSKEVTAFALKYLPARSWSSLVKGFSWSRFEKMGGYTEGKLKVTTSVTLPKVIPNNLKYAYNGSAGKKGSITTVNVDSNVNPVIYSGAGWKFSKRLDFTERNRFTCKVLVKGLKERYAHVRVRFYSGAHIFESGTKIVGNETRQIAVNLSKWAHKDKVYKIQVWVRPFNSTGWYNGAQILVSEMKQCS